ncbi:MAG: hypothetical protein ACJAT2_000482 [Bacteriovoracaceae bacterium]|jgi:hypothetical protein
MIYRRTFFKLGFSAAFILGGAYSISKSLEFESMSGFKFLDKSDAATLNAFIPVILEGTELKKKEIPEVIQNIEEAISGLSPSVQGEIGELLLLFKWRPLRWSTGRNSPWSEASFEEIDSLLVSWANHNLELYRSAYSALCELVNASYYSMERSWPTIGYPGPPELDREESL